MIDKAASLTPFGTIGQYVGGNIPGKPKRYLLNAGGRPKLHKEIARVKATDYAAFRRSQTGPALAESLIAEGALWNAGTFLWKARVVLEELANAPELAAALPALAAGDLPGFCGNVQHVSLDRGLLEAAA